MAGKTAFGAKKITSNSENIEKCNIFIKISVNKNVYFTHFDFKFIFLDI